MARSSACHSEQPRRSAVPRKCYARQRTDWDAFARLSWQCEDTLDPAGRLQSPSAPWGNLDAWLYARALREAA